MQGNTISSSLYTLIDVSTRPKAAVLQSFAENDPPAPAITETASPQIALCHTLLGFQSYLKDLPIPTLDYCLLAHAISRVTPKLVPSEVYLRTAVREAAATANRKLKKANPRISSLLNVNG